jgi:phosphatidylserine/phosphatidylglycerophosphate/cardiolipin synthase-like enzyme
MFISRGQGMKLEVITNPVIDTFLKLIRDSSEQLLASPFIKTNVASMIIENKPKEAKMSLLTNYKLNNFYRSSSDIKAIQYFIENDIRIRNYPKLHAKTYIFDSERAIITSGNLTLGGLQNNYECGVLISDTDTVKKLKSDFLQIFLNEQEVSEVTEEILLTTENILSKIPKEKKIHFEKSEKEIFAKNKFEPEDDLYEGGIDSITGSLSGWRLDVFNLVLKVPSHAFKLEQIYLGEEKLQLLHPDNRNIKAKIRQQLQELRDLGLLEFLGSGTYRKLWKNM